MRPPTMVVTGLASVAVLMAGWHEGARSPSGPLPGVHVIAQPSGSASSNEAGTSPARPQPTTSSTKKAKKKTSKKATPQATTPKPTTPAPPSRREFAGAVVGTPYGDVQVSVVITGHQITNVRALHLTDANDRSRQISADAAPTLRREALAQQSAQIDTVSGATYTSQGYQQSLQAALDQAHF